MGMNCKRSKRDRKQEFVGPIQLFQANDDPYWRDASKIIRACVIGILQTFQLPEHYLSLQLTILHTVILVISRAMLMHLFRDEQMEDLEATENFILSPFLKPVILNIYLQIF